MALLRFTILAKKCSSALTRLNAIAEKNSMPAAMHVSTAFGNALGLTKQEKVKVKVNKDGTTALECLHKHRVSSFARVVAVLKALAPCVEDCTLVGYGDNSVAHVREEQIWSLFDKKLTVTQGEVKVLGQGFNPADVACSGDPKYKVDDDDEVDSTDDEDDSVEVKDESEDGEDGEDEEVVDGDDE